MSAHPSPVRKKHPKQGKLKFSFEHPKAHPSDIRVGDRLVAHHKGFTYECFVTELNTVPNLDLQKHMITQQLKTEGLEGEELEARLTAKLEELSEEDRNKIVTFGYGHSAPQLVGAKVVASGRPNRAQRRRMESRSFQNKQPVHRTTPIPKLETSIDNQEVSND